MEIARHWRNRHALLRLEGQQVEIDGKTFVGIGTSLHEFSPNGNGHHKEEDPLAGPVYLAPIPHGENGRNGNGHKPINVSGEIRIPSLADKA